MSENRKFAVNCTAKSETEKEYIKAIFKKNHISMAGYLMDCLRKKAIELGGYDA